MNKRKINTEDFHNTVLDDAQQLLQLTIARSGGFDLDRQSSIWLMTMEAWRDVLLSRDYFQHAGDRPKQLFGIPVRVSVYDEPDIPRIQLLMEPMLMAR